MLINTAFGNKNKVKPKDLMKLPYIDDNVKVNIPTKEERLKLLENLKEQGFLGK